jgi:excisionase family DNA binding protein
VTDTATELLTVKEVAVLKGCSERYVRNLISQNKIEFTQDKNPKNNKKQYLIPVSALEPKQQAKYYRHQPKREKPLPDMPIKPLDSFTLSERKEIDGWISVIKEWLGYRFGEDKPEADEQFVADMQIKHPDMKVSVDKLYRRWKAWRDQDYDGLIDKRGKWKKGQTSMPDLIWQAFLSYYLDEAQHPIERCYQYTQLWAKQAHPEMLLNIPSYHTFYRRIQNDIPEPVKVLGRQGDKAYHDRCAPYISRTYDDMESNDYWIADNHTFDIITAGTDGKTHRLYLTAFFDARAGIFTGFTITDNPCSDATLYALRKGIMKYGIPKNLYVDNGREFLTHDVGGLGHRQKKSTAENFEPPGVFKRLGITMINAQVRNAKAKIIERRFRDVKDQLSRVFETFCGGNVIEKPEKLKGVLKDGNIPTDKDLLNAVETLLEYYFNEQPYGGSVAQDRGKPRIEVYQNNLRTKRVASEDDLNLMMMRSSRLQKVGRRGVHLDISGARIDFWNSDLLNTYFGQEVYYRYDPEDLTQVRIYDKDDRFVLVAQADSTAVLRYGADKNDIKAAQQKVRQVEKANKTTMQNSMLAVCDRITALDIILADAAGKKAARMVDQGEGAKILEIQRVDERPLLQAVNGDIPLDRMVRNLERGKNNKPD